MKCLLKWYFWYKNLWDEILLFWFIDFLFENFEIEKLYIEAWDKKWLHKWFSMNSKYLDKNLDRIEIINKWDIWDNNKDIMLILWWWEVLAPQRKFPYNGWTYIFKYSKHILSGNFMLFGGVSNIKTIGDKILFNLILPRAKNIIVREIFSYEIVKKYNENVILHNDFAFDVFKKYTQNKLSLIQKDRILLNINSYIYNEDSMEKILNFVSEFIDNEKYYMPFDIWNDTKYYEILKTKIDDLELFDWTNCSLDEILEFIGTSSSWIWARLHFLLLLHWFEKHPWPLKYQEKVEKFFRN